MQYVILDTPNIDLIADSDTGKELFFEGRHMASSGVPSVPAGLLAREQALVQGAAAGGRQQGAAALCEQ